MSTGTYTYSRTTTQEDNNSFTRYIDLPVKSNCGQELPFGWSDQCCAWNCNLCGNDKPYFQPLKRTDKIHLQFKFKDTFNGDSGVAIGWNTFIPPTPTGDWIIGIDIVSCDTCESGVYSHNIFPDVVSDYVCGRTADGVDYQNIILDVSGFPRITCFKLAVSWQRVVGPPTDPRDIRTFYSEPFEIMDCENSMELEGTYIARDKYGNYYSTAPAGFFAGSSNFAHRALKRFRGSAEESDKKVQKTLDDTGAVTDVSSEDGFSFYMKEIPPYEADSMGIILGGIGFIVDGVAHQDVTGFKKNNRESRMWLPEFTSRINISNPRNNPANGCITT